MKEYKLVLLTPDFKLSRTKDLDQAQKIVNEYVAEGWTLQQIATPDDGLGTLVGLFYKEN